MFNAYEDLSFFSVANADTDEPRFSSSFILIFDCLSLPPPSFPVTPSHSLFLFFFRPYSLVPLSLSLSLSLPSLPLSPLPHLAKTLRNPDK